MRPSSEPALSTRRGFTFLELIVALSLILLLAGMMFPVFVRCRQSARRTNCQSNLKQLVTALHLYAQDNNGRFPPTESSPEWITTLMPRVKNSGVLACPSEPQDLRHRYLSGLPAGSGGTAGSSYRYVAGLSNDDPPGSVVLSEWGQWHFDGANVAFLDGRVEWLHRNDSPLPAAQRPLP